MVARGVREGSKDTDSYRLVLAMTSALARSKSRCPERMAASNRSALVSTSVTALGINTTNPLGKRMTKLLIVEEHQQVILLR